MVSLSYAEGVVCGELEDFLDAWLSVSEPRGSLSLSLRTCALSPSLASILCTCAAYAFFSLSSFHAMILWIVVRKGGQEWRREPSLFFPDIFLLGWMAKKCWHAAMKE